MAPVKFYFVLVIWAESHSSEDCWETYVLTKQNVKWHKVASTTERFHSNEDVFSVPKDVAQAMKAIEVKECQHFVQWQQYQPIVLVFDMYFIKNSKNFRAEGKYCNTHQHSLRSHLVHGFTINVGSDCTSSTLQYHHWYHVKTVELESKISEIPNGHFIIYMYNVGTMRYDNTKDKNPSRRERCSFSKRYVWLRHKHYRRRQKSILKLVHSAV